MKSVRTMVRISSLVQLLLAMCFTQGPGVHSQGTHAPHRVRGKIRQHTNVHAGGFDSYQPSGFRMCLSLCASQPACLSITHNKATLMCILRSVDASTAEVYHDIDVSFTEIHSWDQIDLNPCHKLACSRSARCVQTRGHQNVCIAFETAFTAEEKVIKLENERNIQGFAASAVNRNVTYYITSSLLTGSIFIAETNYKTTSWRSIKILGMQSDNVSHAHFGYCQQSGEFCLYMGISYSRSQLAKRIYYVRHKVLKNTSARAGCYIIENIKGPCDVFFLTPTGRIYTVESGSGEGEGGTLHLLNVGNNALRSVDRTQLVNAQHLTMVSLTLDGKEMLTMMQNKACYSAGPDVIGKLDSMCQEGLQLNKNATFVTWSQDGLNLLSLERYQEGYQLRCYVRTKKKLT